MHEKMESLADLYAAGGLNPDERCEVDVHVASCASCAAMIHEATDFRRWITGTIAPDAPPADLEERVIAQLRVSAALKTRRFLPGKRLLKVAGGLAAAAGFVFLGNAFSQGAPNLKDLETAEADFRSNDRSGNTVDKLHDGDFREIHNGWDGYLSFKDGKGGPKESNYFAYAPSDLRSDGAYSERQNAPRNWAYWGDDRTGSLSHLGWAGPRFKDKLEDTSKPSFAIEDEAVHNYPSSKVAGKGKDMGGESEKLAKLQPENSGKEGRINDLQRQLNSANSLTTKSEADMQVFTRQLEVQLAQQQELATKATEARGKLNEFPGVDLNLIKPPPKPEPSPANPALVQDARKIIRTADVDLEVDSYDATSTKITEMVRLEKGFVASANVQKLANGKIKATVTVRIPPERFEAVIAKLKDLGTVRNQNVGSQDITKAYLDLETRRDAKQALLERLKKLLAEAKGTLKELLEVEVQMGKTIEEIESIKGELKFYDNQVGLSTLVLTVSEKDLGLPFEYVQTLQSNIGLTARDADDVYAKAQKEIADAGGQVVDSRMNRQNDGSATGTIRARVDAEKFPALREALKKLGHVTNDTVNQQKTARGGQEGTPKPDAPLKKEQAVVELSISTPPIVVTRRASLLVEFARVQDAYPDARKTIEAAGGKIVNGSLTGRENGATAGLVAQIDAEKFNALVETLKNTGKLKDSRVRLDLPAATPDGAPALLRERAEIELVLVPPPQLIDDEHGIGKTVRDTFAGSWKGILWSFEKLFVGLALAGPWLVLALAGWLVWRRFRKKKAAA